MQQQTQLDSSNSVFGDPCLGTYKYLEVEFQGVFSSVQVDVPIYFTIGHTCRSPKRRRLHVNHIMNGQCRQSEIPVGNHGSCIHQNKYPVQDDEYNYHDSCTRNSKMEVAICSRADWKVGVEFCSM